MRISHFSYLDYFGTVLCRVCVGNQICFLYIRDVGVKDRLGKQSTVQSPSNVCPFLAQIFPEYLLCAGHCSGSWGFMVTLTF